MAKIIRRIEQWLCLHPKEKQTRRSKDGRLYLECMGCGHESAGIQTGR